MKQTGEVLRFKERDGQIVEGQIVDIKIMFPETTERYVVEWFDTHCTSTVRVDSPAIVD